MNEKLDLWQEEVMKTKGSMVLRSGRQVGKSFVIGIKAAKYAIENSDKLIMVISKTEKQAQLLFAKILRNIMDIDPKQIAKGKGVGQNPTKTKIQLKNKSIIYCLCAGDTGYGLMGYTIDLLIADEAAFIPEEVWNSVIPALAITRGSIWLLSTPFVKEGYYYECFEDPTFTAFHTSSEDCPRRDDVFLAHKKEHLTKSQYAQMYLGQFIDEIRQFLPDDLIKECCVLKRKEAIKGHNYYYGCDVARKDRDEFVHGIGDKISRDYIEQVENITTKDIPIPENVRKIIDLNKSYNFRLEYIDSGGMGIAVCDLLREDPRSKNKVIEINNASRIYNEDEGKKNILKEELYNNLKTLMQNGKIKLLDDNEVKASLKSIQAEYNPKTGRLMIWGSYSHIAESIIRWAWCMKDKTLNIMEFCKGLRQNGR